MRCAARDAGRYAARIYAGILIETVAVFGAVWYLIML